jgi:hypothetical protein
VFRAHLSLFAALPLWLLALSGVTHAGGSISRPEHLDQVEIGGKDPPSHNSYSRVQSASVSPQSRNSFVTSSDR